MSKNTGKLAGIVVYPYQRTGEPLAAEAVYLRGAQVLQRIPMELFDFKKGFGMVNYGPFPQV